MYGGPHGEIGASLRYLSQRYAMPYPELKAILTDVGTEELGHLEMVGTLVYQLTRNLTPEQIQAAGYDAYFVNHTTGVYPQNASGEPFNADGLSSTGDTLADIHEDLAAEQKARMTYDNILRFCGDEPDVRDAIRFLRAREVVHYQRFGETKRTRGQNRKAAEILGLFFIPSVARLAILDVIVHWGRVPRDNLVHDFQKFFPPRFLLSWIAQIKSEVPY